MRAFCSVYKSTSEMRAPLHVLKPDCNSLLFSLLAMTDSSGIVFTYISTPREHNAGILYLGHFLNQNMVIPPRAANYTVLGICSGACTGKVN